MRLLTAGLLVRVQLGEPKSRKAIRLFLLFIFKGAIELKRAPFDVNNKMFILKRAKRGKMGMLCPYCKQEMKSGTLNWHSGNMAWFPKDTRPPQREGDYVEGAVRLEQSYNGLRPYLQADWCPACRKIIIDV